MEQDIVMHDFDLMRQLDRAIYRHAGDGSVADFLLNLMWGQVTDPRADAITLIEWLLAGDAR
jgi:hypothetical protein